MDEIDVSGWVNRPKEQKRSRKEILERRKKRRRQRIVARIVFAALLLLCATLLFLLLRLVWRQIRDFVPTLGGQQTEIASETWEGTVKETEAQEDTVPPWETVEGRPEMTEDFLTPNPYSRPGEPLHEINNIFIHYTANMGTSAAQNRSYFENLGLTGETSASAHYVIGFDGEIIQCLPLDEIGYAVKTRNYDSVSIECCYTSEDGSFTAETYQSLVELTGWLLKVFELEPEDVLRHYDVGGKKCPLYYVENEEAWEEFLQNLETE